MDALPRGRMLLSQRHQYFQRTGHGSLKKHKKGQCGWMGLDEKRLERKRSTMGGSERKTKEEKEKTRTMSERKKKRGGN